MIRSDKDHVFKLKLDTGKVIKRQTPVYYANKKVILELDKEQVLDALNKDGKRNPGKCAGNNMCRQNTDAFPHRVFPEWIDWWTSRVFVCNRVDKHYDPKSCVVYKHEERVAGRPISDLFDDENGGLKMLLTYIERHGPISIVLYPIKKVAHKQSGKNRPSGKSRPIGAGRGAIRRLLTVERTG